MTVPFWARPAPKVKSSLILLSFCSARFTINLPLCVPHPHTRNSHTALKTEQLAMHETAFPSMRVRSALVWTWIESRLRFSPSEAPAHQPSSALAPPAVGAVRSFGLDEIELVKMVVRTSKPRSSHVWGVLAWISICGRIEGWFVHIDYWDTLTGF